MKRKLVSVLLLLAALSGSLVSADLPAAWRSWRYSRSISPAGSDALGYLTLDRDVFSHSENRLADLRIIDEAGQELPYDIRSHITPPAQPVNVPATIRENSFSPGRFTQVLLDLGSHTGFHNSLRVQTPESDFINWVQVDASDDAHLWRVVNPRAPISRFLREDLEGNQTVRYSENNARYLRVRIEESGHSFKVSNIEVFSSPAVQADKPEGAPPLAASLAPDAGREGSSTQWTVDLGSANIPVAKFDFATDRPEFYRAVRVLTSQDGHEWQPAGGGEIHRYTASGKIEESLSVQCYESWGSRFWRVEVLNLNDAPLSAVRLSVAMPLRYVLFHGSAGRSYRLLYGNARATSPRYDLGRTLQIPPMEAMLHPELGSPEVTTNYADPRPFTEKHPNLLWIALATAVVMLGYAALRALHNPLPPGTAS